MSEFSKKIMEDQRLFASAALFRQLHDNKKDIYGVLSQFIHTSIVLNRTWVFNVTTIAKQLLDDFGFKIPEAVIKKCIRNRLKREGHLHSEGATYSVTNKFDKCESIKSSFESVQHEQEIIKEQLISFVETARGSKLDEKSKEELVASFYSYFINKDRNSENAVYISQFIVINSSDDNFTLRLNTVEEGLLLYHGINYSSNLINTVPWRNDFQLYLDTEVLFDAVGLNGAIHKKIFLEFHGLVRELAENSKKKVKIELKYFDETLREIEDFFYAAEKLVENNRQPDPQRSGMIEIVNGCKSATDVIAKKSVFFENLRTLKITLDEHTDYYSNPQYNMESTQRIEKLKALNPEYEYEKIADVLRVFTKINHKRKGINSKSLEASGALLITGKNITRSIAYSIASENAERQAQFAYDIDFITERLWFKLNKGFGGDNRLPTTFDVVARAQVVLSSQTGNKITQEFRDIIRDVELGCISSEMAGYMIADLRARTFKPEDFVPDIIDDNISFMLNDTLEKTTRNITLLKQQAKEGVENQLKLEKLSTQLAIKEIEEKSLTDSHVRALEEAELRRQRDLRQQNVGFRKQSYAQYRIKAKRFSILIYIGYLLLIACVFIISFVMFRNPEDTTLSLISGFGPIVIVALTTRKISEYTKKYGKRKYKKILRRYRININKLEEA